MQPRRLARRTPGAQRQGEIDVFADDAINVLPVRIADGVRNSTNAMIAKQRVIGGKEMTSSVGKALLLRVA